MALSDLDFESLRPPAEDDGLDFKSLRPPKPVSPRQLRASLKQAERLSQVDERRGGYTPSMRVSGGPGFEQPSRPSPIDTGVTHPLLGAPEPLRTMERTVENTSAFFNPDLGEPTEITAFKSPEQFGRPYEGLVRKLMGKDESPLSQVMRYPTPGGKGYSVAGGALPITETEERMGRRFLQALPLIGRLERELFAPLPEGESTQEIVTDVVGGLGGVVVGAKPFMAGARGLVGSSTKLRRLLASGIGWLGYKTSVNPGLMTDPKQVAIAMGEGGLFHLIGGIRGKKAYLAMYAMGHTMSKIGRGADLTTIDGWKPDRHSIIEGLAFAILHGLNRPVGIKRAAKEISRIEGIKESQAQQVIEDTLADPDYADDVARRYQETLTAIGALTASELKIDPRVAERLVALPGKAGLSATEQANVIGIAAAEAKERLGVERGLAEGERRLRLAKGEERGARKQLTQRIPKGAYRLYGEDPDLYDFPEEPAPPAPPPRGPFPGAMDIPAAERISRTRQQEWRDALDAVRRREAEGPEPEPAPRPKPTPTPEGSSAPTEATRMETPIEIGKTRWVTPGVGQKAGPEPIEVVERRIEEIRDVAERESDPARRELLQNEVDRLADENGLPKVPLERPSGEVAEIEKKVQGQIATVKQAGQPFDLSGATDRGSQDRMVFDQLEGLSDGTIVRDPSDPDSFYIINGKTSKGEKVSIEIVPILRDGDTYKIGAPEFVTKKGSRYKSDFEPQHSWQDTEGNRHVTTLEITSDRFDPEGKRFVREETGGAVEVRAQDWFPKLVTAEPRIEPSAEAKQPATGPLSNLHKAWNRYNDTGETTFPDFVDEVEAIADDLPTKERDQIEDAVERYREAEKEDYKLKGRGDMDAAEAEFEKAVQSILRPTAKTATTEPPDIIRNAVQAYLRDGTRGADWFLFQVASTDDIAEMDRWLVQTNHPLASQPGTHVSRFRELVLELARKEQSAQPGSETPTESVIDLKRKTVKRTVRGRQRQVEIVTFRGPLTDDAYSAFLEQRNRDGGELRTGKKSPQVEIDGKPVWSSYERMVDEPPAEPVVDVEPKPVAETPTQEKARLEGQAEAPADVVVGAEQRFPVSGIDRVKNFPDFLRDFVKVVPEFRESPVFTVTDDGMLQFRDNYDYRLRPDFLGLDAAELIPGQTVRVDIDAILGTKYEADPIQDAVVRTETVGRKHYKALSLGQRWDGEKGQPWIGKQGDVWGPHQGAMVLDEIPDVPERRFLRNRWDHEPRKVEAEQVEKIIAYAETDAQPTTPEEIQSKLGESKIKVVRFGPEDNPDGYLGFRDVRFAEQNWPGGSWRVSEHELDVPSGEEGKPAERIRKKFFSYQDKDGNLRSVQMGITFEEGWPPEGGEFGRQRFTPTGSLRGKKRKAAGGGRGAFIASAEDVDLVDFEAKPGTARGMLRGDVLPIAMPEMVKLAEELIGDVPKIKKKLGQASGQMRSLENIADSAKILIRADTAKDPKYLAQVLAHEIGHVIDFAPEGTLKRGNVWGHIATLRKFLKGTFGASKVTNKELRKELWDLSKWWRPFDENAVSKSHLKYRKSAVELYADALSVFINSPGLLEERAPKFYKEFTERLDKKPDVLDAFLALQDFLHGTPEDIASARRNDLYEDFGKADVIIRAREEERRAARPGVFEAVRQVLSQYILSRTSPADAKVRQAEKLGVSLEEAEAARYALDELYQPENRFVEFATKVERDVTQPLHEVGITKDQLGEYLFLNRVMGDRAEVANPHGWVPEEAAKQVEDLRRTLTPEQFAELEARAQKFHDYWFELMEQAASDEYQVFSKKQFSEIIEPNRDSYATFSVLKYLADRLPVRIRAQIGTFRGVANPFDAMSMQALTLTRLMELQRAKLAFQKLMLNVFPNEMVQEEVPWGRNEPTRKPPPGRSFLFILRDGKPTWHLVDRYIADSFKLSNIGYLSTVGRAIQSPVYRMFHPLYVTFNPSFMAGNLPRDLLRTWKNLGTIGHRTRNALEAKLKEEGLTKAEIKKRLKHKRISLGNVLYSLWKTKGAAYRRARGIPDELIDRMYADKSLTVPFVDPFAENADAHPVGLGITEDMLIRYGVRQPELNRKGLRKVLRLFDAVHAANLFFETWTKTAGYDVLGTKGITGPERAFVVRNYVGTPNFRHKGLATDLTNGLWMYSNVRWQGLRTDAQLAFSPSTAGGWWWRTTLLNFVPKLAGAAALYGMFGDDVKRLTRKVGDYHHGNYDVLPLGIERKTGKTVFLSMPQDDFGRLWGAILWKMLMAPRNEQAVRQTASQVFRELKSEALPALNPIADMAWKWTQYAAGQNPVDTWRGQEIVPGNEWQAGGWYADRRMLSWTLNKFGVASVIAHGLINKATGDPWEANEGTIEIIVKSIPGLQRLLRVSDRGELESIWNSIEHKERESARFRLGLPKNVHPLLSERSRLVRLGAEELTDEQKRRKARLNRFYNGSESSYGYLDLTAAMKSARERGDDEQFEELSDTLHDLAERYKEILSQSGQ